MWSALRPDWAPWLLTPKGHRASESPCHTEPRAPDISCCCSTPALTRTTKTQVGVSSRTWLALSRVFVQPCVQGAGLRCDCPARRRICQRADRSSHFSGYLQSSPSGRLGRLVQRSSRDAETTLFGSSGTMFRTRSLFFGLPAVGAHLNDVGGSLGCRDRELRDDRPDWAPWLEVGCAAASSRVRVPNGSF